MRVVEGIKEHLIDGVELYAGRIVKEDGAQFIRLELWNGNYLLKAIDADELNLSSQLCKIYPYGFRGGRYVLELIGAAVLESLKEVAPVLSTKTLGFVEQYGDVVGFQGVEWIPAPEGVDEAVSEGDLPKPVGTMNIEKLKKLLKEKTALQLVVLWNLIAPLVSFLSDCYAVCNPILLLHGKSSHGKTTAATLSASMSCNVDYKRLINGLATTDNALMLKLGGINGMGVVLDDTSNSGIKRITDVLYSLSDGFGKTRATSRGGMIQSTSFKTSIILTSESNLLDYADVEKEGLYGRVFTLDVGKHKLFKDAAEASEVMDFSRESAGHMISEIVNSIFETGIMRLKNRVDMKEQEFLNEYGCDNSIVARWGKIISIMEVTAEMSSLDFDMEGIKKLMVNDINQSLGWVRGVQSESQIDNFYEACVESGIDRGDYMEVTTKIFKDCFKDCIMSGLNQKTLKLKMLKAGYLESTKSEVGAEAGTNKAYRYYRFLKKKEEDKRDESSTV